MNSELSITHERLDDIPVIFEMARRLRLPEILDEALGRHGNHEGLSYGWLATTWLAYMLAEGDHRKSVVEAWAERRRPLLERLTGEMIALIQGTQTKTGLTVKAEILDGVYKTGKKVSKKVMALLDLVPAEVCPRWNYTLQPRPLSDPPNTPGIQALTEWDLVALIS
jgi:hypothetical protein